MSQTIPLSVIIPITSIDRTIDVCLLSILGQDTFCDLEVVCALSLPKSDMDTTILQSWAKRDKRVIIQNNIEGVSDAINHALRTVRGGYILLMRQTDALSSCSNLLKQYKDAVKQGTDVCVMSQELRITADFLWESPGLFSPKCRHTFFKNPVVSSLKKQELLVSVIPVPWGNLFSADFLQNSKIVLPSITSFPETLFFVETILSTNKISMSSLPVLSGSLSNRDGLSANESIQTFTLAIGDLLYKKLPKRDYSALISYIADLSVEYAYATKNSMSKVRLLRKFYTPPKYGRMTWKECLYKMYTDIIKVF